MNILSSSADRIALVCTTPELQKLYAQGHKESKTIELSERALDFPMGSKELLAYTLGHMDGSSD